MYNKEDADLTSNQRMVRWSDAAHGALLLLLLRLLWAPAR